METGNAIELKGVTKRFGDVIANDNVNLTVRKGEILSILGENGSGKTTLMNMLSGIYFPDEGEVYVDGKEVTIRSPKDSFALGIGMIHQHFKLINILTAAENIILGLPGKEKLNMKQVEKEIRELTEQYGFDLNPSQKIYDMSVSQKQTVEIVKVLYRGADILILDEPTAVLTPQETEKLFAVLRNMRKAGKSIIIITHKLNEVLELSDRVAVLRKGKYIDTVETAKATVESLTEMMVGEKVKLDINRTEPVGAEKRIEMRGITCYFSQEGTTEKISEMKAEDIKNLGITLSFVPEDRLGMGLVGSMDLTDNMMIRSYKEGRHFFADRKSPKKLAEDIVEKLDVVTPGVDTPVSRLSGGNVQKLLVGREIASNPMVAYPVRGLDINSSYTIYNLLNDQKKKGVAVICVGEDLDVLLELCDKILVLNSGKVAGIVDARTTTKEKLGLMMTGLTEDKNE